MNCAGHLNFSRALNGAVEPLRITFSVTLMDLVLKMMDFVLQMMDFILKLMDFILNMVGFMLTNTEFLCSHWEADGVRAMPRTVPERG